MKVIVPTPAGEAAAVNVKVLDGLSEVMTTLLAVVVEEKVPVKVACAPVAVKVIVPVPLGFMVRVEPVGAGKVFTFAVDIAGNVGGTRKVYAEHAAICCQKDVIAGRGRAREHSGHNRRNAAGLNDTLLLAFTTPTSI